MINGWLMEVIGVGIPWLCCGEEWKIPLFMQLTMKFIDII